MLRGGEGWDRIGFLGLVAQRQSGRLITDWSLVRIQAGPPPKIPSPLAEATSLMILWHFRQHLAEEIRNFPAEPNEAVQSYAVTTAALARKILDYLNVEDLTLPNGLEPEEPPYQLGTVLNRIIHFKTLGQDAISFDYPGKPDLVTLYSDKSLPFSAHIYLRLFDYREAIEGLANDDFLVGNYLLRKAMTLMAKAENTEKPKTHKQETSHNDLRRMVYELIANSWHIVYSLERSGKVEIEPEPFDCYEDPYDGRAKTYGGITNWKEFIEGYRERWIFAPFNPSRVDVEGSDIYCMFLDARRIDGKQGTMGIALPFGTINSMFAGVRKQIAEALAERDLSAKRTEN